MEEQKRGRGRPPNTKSPDRERQDDPQKDEVIARCVGHLIWLGFTQRGHNGVYAVVARCAREVLDRHDHTDKRLPLGEERVEQIYEVWREQDFRRQWARKNFAKNSLQDRVPCADDGNQKQTLHELAAELLRNGGRAPRDGDAIGIGHGDATMTPKAHAEYVENGVGFIGKNGVIK
jgi:hypothetical protein